MLVGFSPGNKNYNGCGTCVAITLACWHPVQQQPQQPQQQQQQQQQHRTLARLTPKSSEAALDAISARLKEQQ
jgi:hypothetical protein